MLWPSLAFGCREKAEALQHSWWRLIDRGGVPVAELLRRPPSRMEWRGWIDAATMDGPTSCSGDLWVISTAYRRGFSAAVRAPHVAEGFVTSGLSLDLDLLLIFHAMTCLLRQMVELSEAIHHCPEPGSEGVQQCCSFHCLCRHEVRKL